MAEWCMDHPWVSVNDRLPERAGLMHDESEYVLVCEDLSDITGLSGHQNVSVCGYTANGWDRYDCFGTIDPERITHWMPLPEPPEENDNV